MEKEAWHAAIPEVAKSRTQLSDWTDWCSLSSRLSSPLQNFLNHYCTVRSLAIPGPNACWCCELYSLLYDSFWTRIRISLKFAFCLTSFLCSYCSVAKSCLTLCDPMDYSMPGFPVLHCFLEFAQTHVHWVNDAIQLSHPLLTPSSPALNLSQHQGLFQWVGSLHQVAKSIGASASALVLPVNAAAAKSLQSCPTLRPHRRQHTRLLHPQDSPGKNTGVGCHFLLQCMKVKSESEVTQSFLTLCDPMDCMFRVNFL